MNLRDEVERAWLSTLGIDHVDHDKSFFDAGGTSFLVAKLLVRLRALEPGLKVAEIFRYPTISSFVESREGPVDEPATGPSETSGPSTDRAPGPGSSFETVADRFRAARAVTR